MNISLVLWFCFGFVIMTETKGYDAGDLGKSNGDDAGDLGKSNGDDAGDVGKNQEKEELTMTILDLETSMIASHNKTDYQFKIHFNKTLEEMKRKHDQEKEELKKKISDLETSMIECNNNKTLEEMKRKHDQEKEELKKTISDLETSMIECNNNKTLEEMKRKHGCTLVSGRCFNIYLDQNRQWNDAKQFCLSKGGFIPEFPNEDFDFMDIHNAFPQLQSRTIFDFWLNVKNDNTDRILKWSSGRVLSKTDRRWYKGQPNNPSATDTCVTLTFHQTYGKREGELLDWTCDLNYKSICEFN